MGNLEISHDVLLGGYDEVLVLENESINGSENEFRTRLQEGLASNQQAIGELLENLKEEGFVTLEDLRALEKGYVSKIFHTIAHLLDGFIGIDSRFYNLEEDSHGISRDLQQKILSAPQNYWVLRVKGRIASAGEEPFHALRTFEWKGKSND